MSKFTITRTNIALPDESGLEVVRRFLFGVIDGFTSDDKRAWRRMWKRIVEADPGEMISIEMVFPRSGKFHRYHMALEQRLFDSQERFQEFEQFRYWLKIGAGWVTWAAGPKGGVVPIPKSISYAKADEEEFSMFHRSVVLFLRGPHAAKFLWPHLLEEGRSQMMDMIVAEFA